ncbi:MAG: hypothetical protein QOH31_5342, partial [Verrucomicrobiota bacterium]
LALLFLLLTRGALGRAIFQKVFLDDGEASRLLQKAHAICKAATANFDVAIATLCRWSSAARTIHRQRSQRYIESAKSAGRIPVRQFGSRERSRRILILPARRIGHPLEVRRITRCQILIF